MKLTSNHLNYISQNSIIYNVESHCNTISLLLQGEVIQNNNDIQKPILPGNFIGIQGLFDGVHCNTYTAKSDITARTFEIDSIKSFATLFIDDPGLHEDMVIEISNFIVQMSELYDSLYTEAFDLYQSIIAIKKHYLQNCDKYNYRSADIPIGTEIDALQITSHNFHDDIELFKKIGENPCIAYKELESSEKKILSKQLSTILNLYKLYLKLKSYIQRLLTIFINKEEVSLFKSISDLSVYATSNDEDNTFIIRLLESMRSLYCKAVEKFKTQFNIIINIDYDYISHFMEMACKVPKYIQDHTLNSPKDSLNNLMNYGGLDLDKQIEFSKLIDNFIFMEDKFSKEDDDRQLYKKICELYYELYEAVFFNYVNDSNQYRVIDLFLNFGFLDERLLTVEQLDSLINFDAEFEESSPCQIYRMKDWLVSIYEGQHMPSKNQFDEDYFDMVRNTKKQEGLNKASENELLNNAVLKTKFEIQNMFKYNNRLISGRLVNFVPMLFKESMETDLNKIILDFKSINNCISSIISVDYSLFYRELIYADEKAKIQKEMIQKEIYPAIILFPIYGSNGMMWQETTRKLSDSSGRFFLPSMTNINLEDIILSILGRFRWELCKNQQSYAWNNIHVPSLTSEYCDYIQFYRKNNELSSEKKELLKNQIAKCRNNMREIFISDYIVWIKYESEGAIRLNAVARRIMSTYCPFSKNIRENLMKQPLFSKAMFKYNHEKNKKIKELLNRYTTLTNNGGQLTQELLDTREFYNDL